MADEKKNIETDYDYSRQTYYDLIEKGRESLEMMIEVAREYEHPRAYEVLSGMIKNISDVNDKLMDLNKKQVDISKTDEEPKQLGGTTNNLYLTTSDLQKMMANTDGKIIDVTPEKD